MCSRCKRSILPPRSLVPTQTCPILIDTSISQTTGVLTIMGSFLNTINAVTFSGPGVVGTTATFPVNPAQRTASSLVVETTIATFTVPVADVYLTFIFSNLPLTYANIPSVTTCPTLLGPFLPTTLIF